MSSAEVPQTTARSGVRLRVRLGVVVFWSSLLSLIACSVTVLALVSVTVRGHGWDAQQLVGAGPWLAIWLYVSVTGLVSVLPLLATSPGRHVR